MSNVCVLLRGCLHRLGWDMRVCRAASHCCHFKKKATSQSLLQHSNVSVLSAAPTWRGGDKKCHRGSLWSALPFGCSQDVQRTQRQTRLRLGPVNQRTVWNMGEILQQQDDQTSSDNWVWDSVAPKQHGLTDEINDVVLGLVSPWSGLSSHSLLR